MNLVPAQSYLINEITPETSKIKKDKLSLIKSGLNLLKILLSINKLELFLHFLVMMILTGTEMGTTLNQFIIVVLKQMKERIV